ncbi:hypothetical protein TSOC_002069 [Tetrabaena socialis]|uniref:Uncharacterized protein n=1 Tax=Tetrabaena socialis TaxID=47790 RepID=A0A2J8AF47_9CHLO|nr:hypothetical protein TSOC_002069 [Tetrabaena socialis]|eukprot:PNH11144.1 hypothetical protein TSOC_002069 [Tetrabaena socialis]
MALPWAAPAAAVLEGALQNAAEAPASGMTLEEAGLAAGGRIEVKWQVEPEDGEPFSRWWGATLVGPSSQEDPQAPGAPIFELAYDAADGFEQERSTVRFTAAHALHQLDQAEELVWRREGEEWEEEESESETMKSRGAGGEGANKKQRTQ